MGPSSSGDDNHLLHPPPLSRTPPYAPELLVPNTPTWALSVLLYALLSALSFVFLLAPLS
jgi:hypothetical protein